MKSLLLGLLLTVSVSAAAQTPDTLLVAWYNLENLFDTSNQPELPYMAGDDEFTPGAKKKWTDERYTQKLEKLSDLINSMNNDSGPDLLGVCEIENQYPLFELITNHLTSKPYKVAYKESQDYRSIDVALIYRSDKFNLESLFAYTVQLENGRTTRDIIQVNLRVGNQPLSVFLNHWPSKSGGAEKSQPNRLAASEILIKAIENQLKLNPDTEMILMGDFNELPTEPAIQNLKSKFDAKTGDPLINVSESIWDQKITGSYKYRGNWEMIDQILINSELNQKGRFQYLDGSFTVYNDMKYRQKEGEYAGYPDRTYAGNNYLGGYSDHLAISIRLLITR